MEITDPRCTKCGADLDRFPHEPDCGNRAEGESTWETISRTRNPNSGTPMLVQKWDGMTRTVKA